jgi:hypothetical protein
VVLVDEVSKSPNEHNVYDIVKVWIDNGFVGKQRSRRGAFFTGLTLIEPWAKQSPSTGRGIVHIPLGTFDVWNVNAQSAITAEARRIWPNLGAIPERVWSLLAATGGRPRDIVNVFSFLCDQFHEVNLVNADEQELLGALFADTTQFYTFAQYLLPSMLSIQFTAFKCGKVSQFGYAAPSPALLNADLLASSGDPLMTVPVVSLRCARSFPLGMPALSRIVKALVVSTTFCSLDGSGKDFERVWVGLTLTHLLLQHALRTTVRVDVKWNSPVRSFAPVAVAPAPGPLVKPNWLFWPVDDKFNNRDFPRPSTNVAIDVFAVSDDTPDRIEALFHAPAEQRVYEAAGASIRRKLSLREQPMLALWHDLWTPTVVGGDLDALPAGWPAATTVEWKSGTVVYLCKTTGEAIDSLLLVGETGGSGANEPHVYFFQHMAHSDALSQGEPKAATSDGSKQKPTLHRMVEKVHAQLDRLLSPSFAATHVLRRAGINRMAQVLHCCAQTGSDRCEGSGRGGWCAVQHCGV